MKQLAKTIAFAGWALVITACSGGTSPVESQQALSASLSCEASDDLGNNFTGNYVWVHGYRSVLADSKYPCLNEFTTCVPLDASGKSRSFDNLCPTLNTPEGTWTLEYYLSADSSCANPMPNIACEIISGKTLRPGANHNAIRCTSRNASTDVDFCVYDPVTGAGAGACN